MDITYITLIEISQLVPNQESEWGLGIVVLPFIAGNGLRGGVSRCIVKFDAVSTNGRPDLVDPTIQSSLYLKVKSTTQCMPFSYKFVVDHLEIKKKKDILYPFLNQVIPHCAIRNCFVLGHL